LKRDQKKHYQQQKGNGCTRIALYFTAIKTGPYEERH
jgi:hypothetical protein